ncbi:MAG TPA: biopolymer transporter ExbD, partial [Xylella fastidiosa subsp. pauca]
MYRRKRRKLKSEINVVPYIDVMLVLLVIFMVTAPLLTLSINVDLPVSNAKALENKQDPIVVIVNSDGKLALQLPKSKP